VENTAEDINSSEGFQGAPGLAAPASVFAFYSPTRILLPATGIVKLRLKNLLFPVRLLTLDSPPRLNRQQSGAVLHANVFTQAATETAF
jgi:hypothetical protein